MVGTVYLDGKYCQEAIMEKGATLLVRRLSDAQAPRTHGKSYTLQTGRVDISSHVLSYRSNYLLLMLLYLPPGLYTGFQT